MYLPVSGSYGTTATEGPPPSAALGVTGSAPPGTGTGDTGTPLTELPGGGGGMYAVGGADGATGAGGATTGGGGGPAAPPGGAPDGTAPGGNGVPWIGAWICSSKVVRSSGGTPWA